MTYAHHLAEESVAIFLLHGVVDGPPRPVRNYTRKHLDKGYFAGFLDQLLGAGGHPLSLDAYVEIAQGRAKLPARSFVITFDDGFENNLSVAAPVLAARKVPATFYVTTGFVSDNRMSWIDRIEYALEPAPPGTLDLPWGRVAFSTDETKRAALDAIRKHVKADRAIEPDELATDVQVALGKSPTWSSDDPLDRKLTWDQVRELAADPLCTVGGHTHTHAILSFLDDERLAWELDTSLGLLKERAGLDVTHYSYPEGLEHCYSPKVIDALRARGIVCCPTAETGVNAARADLFRLRRVMVT